ncbi:tripartite tricarboxylate transporter substrate binding protein [Litorivicinus lipolyticus]|uniref:Tripartite tricarboxylate transporter substrate binding protein n=1 Tax=Litorivicinus lipolyticus TaxID=418701 RepID=A0A5Q2QDM3_9GAMM|nr:tripartite tricarboxylate transporter substrate-binding protein [Litorivicinus lipolyticus]QGG80461.1 tripartite tricarboxylate transporter substrate binding protein [Litorivicinus lipolyticus]
MKTTITKSLAALGVASAVAFSAGAYAQVDSIHFVIPGGAGGGWDGTARGTGEALTKSGLVGNASYENMSGGGGGKAIGYLIENAASSEGTLMVNSTPIVIRSLTKVFPQSFRDLTPIAGTIGDYAALVVKADSPVKSFKDLVDIYNSNPSDLAIAGGSVAGGMDHLVAAMAMKAAGADPLSVNYLPFDAGGEAMASLLSGEADALSTGLSEAVALAEQGEIRILVQTGDKRVSAAADVPTLSEQGYDAVFINWRGFFGAPGLSEAKQAEYVKALGAMYDTPEWEDVRARNGWVNIYNPGADFTKFLEKQEAEIGGLMKELGFL